MPAPSSYPPISYSEYLKVNSLLDLQKPRSKQFGQEAHEELLFIVIHQTYELWFKQVLHELNSILGLFSNATVREADMGTAVARLTRVVEILRVLVDQISILETMTPLDFLDFRDMLYPASGFQSVQWRLVENKLGLRADKRLKYNAVPYHAHVSASEQAELLKSESEPSLFDRLNSWLARTPFLESPDFDFLAQYGKTVRDMLDADREAVKRHAKSDEDRNRNLKQIDESSAVFDCMLDSTRYQELRDNGTFRLEHKALQAALLILLYRDQPIFSLPFQLLTRLQDIDELMTTWRYRHSLMVHRMLGTKIGTGGSSGAHYLKAATESHRIFADLFNLATFLVPRSKLPPLPESLTKRLGFNF